MTLGQVIEKIDMLRPNPYNHGLKAAWISRVEGEVALDIEKNQAFSPYAYPRDSHLTLMIPTPFDELYLFYLSAMIDFYGKDMAGYNNSMMLYNVSMDDYRKWKRRTEHAPTT